MAAREIVDHRRTIMSVLAIHQRGYTNPQLLAETDWLEQHLNDSNVCVVDARPPQQLRFSEKPE
jgi:hypothetical protein